MIFTSLLFTALVLGGVEKVVKPSPLSRFVIKNTEGFLVFVEKEALKNEPQIMEKVMEEMADQLYQVRLALPLQALSFLQEKVPFWVAFQGGPGLSFHPSFRWLLANGYSSPEGVTSLVSNCKAKSFLKASLHQRWVVLHELSHGYDFLFLGKGKHYTVPPIEKCFQEAKARGIYESVLCRYARATRHYALTNPMEYFAESTEAFFGVNDFYPFVRAELQEVDPECVKMLSDLWGVDLKADQKRREEFAKLIQSTQASIKTLKLPNLSFSLAGYKKRNLRGWEVWISPSLVRKVGLCESFLELLRHQLYLIQRHLPSEAVKKLQRFPIRLEERDRQVPYVAYVSFGKKRRKPWIVVGNARRFYEYQDLDPSCILNAFARAYLDFMPQQAKQRVEGRLREVRRKRLYERVLRFDGRRVLHPCLKSYEDFFAEMTESLYGVNNTWPFLQWELKEHDPETAGLIAELWGGPPP